MACSFEPPGEKNVNNLYFPTFHFRSVLEAAGTALKMDTLWLSVLLRNSNFFQSSGFTPGEKVVARPCSADLPWTGCCQWGGLMLIKFLCSRSHHVALWGPGQGSQYGAEGLEGPAPLPGKGDWVQDGEFPPKGGGQNPVFSAYVKQRFGLHQFLQQILQCKNHFYLLLPAAAYAGMSPPQGHSRAGTRRYHHGFVHGRGYVSKFFLSLPAPSVCSA